MGPVIGRGLTPARFDLPKARAGQCIGLLGGSFDPPHEGHAHISREALKRFGLDQVWWLVSPGNPLKSEGPAPMERRIEAAQALVKHPSILVSNFEARIGTRFTAETIEALMSHYPGVRFVWLMGADNLASFHLWDRWRWIMENVPIGVLARPGQRVSARKSVAAGIYAPFRLRGREAARLCALEAPAWCFVNVPMVNVSSTEIRARGDWVR